MKNVRDCWGSFLGFLVGCLHCRCAGLIALMLSNEGFLNVCNNVSLVWEGITLLTILVGFVHNCLLTNMGEWVQIELLLF